MPCIRCSKKETTFACLDCDGSLCTDCTLIHQFSESFENHQIVDIEYANVFDDFNGKDQVTCRPCSYDNLLPREIAQISTSSSDIFRGLFELGFIWKEQQQQKMQEDEKEGEFGAIGVPVQREFDSRNWSKKLVDALAEVQMHRVQASNEIKQIFQVYTAVLEKIQRDVCDSLGKACDERYFQLSNELKSIEKLNDEGLLHCKLQQLAPGHQEIASFSVELANKNPSLFEQLVKENFGKLQFGKQSQTSPFSTSAPIENTVDSHSNDLLMCVENSSTLPTFQEQQNLDQLVKIKEQLIASQSLPLLIDRTMLPMLIHSKFGRLGSEESQFNSPHGFCLGVNEDIVIADTNNHRIQVFNKSGTYKYEFGIVGKEEGQLWCPRKVAMMKKSGNIVVCDRGNERSRLQIFTIRGNFVKKITIRLVDIVAGIATFVAENDNRIVLVDSVTPGVIVVSADNDEYLRFFDCSDLLCEPSDVAVNGNEFFICDFKGHCVVVIDHHGQFLRRIGGINLTNFPSGVDISDDGDVLVGDSHGNRFHVSVFSKEGKFLTEFECPHVKISRCCGLKITSEGYVITVAKNNHHVLIFDTLYI